MPLIIIKDYAEVSGMIKESGMKLFGADFSGAKDPSKGIYYAQGTLKNRTLHIERLVHCDDRLDLLAAIHFSKSPWGVDFPFSIPVEAFKCFKVNNWPELIDTIVEYNRKEFDFFITDNGIDSCNGRCKESSLCCRANDATINSFSPLKKVKPNVRMMTYAGLKFLSYVRRLGNTVYPFDQFNEKVSRLYEVYPSDTWDQVGLSRSTDLEPFIKKFSERYGLKITIEKHMKNLTNLDQADAIVACVTLAYALERYGLEDDWNRQHSWINDLEWANRHLEGLIVKVVGLFL